jgi:hypothetical protein
MTQVAREVEEVHAFSNNCHMGSSYVDALRLKQRLGQPVRSGRETPATLFASGQPPSYVDQLARRVSEARNAERRDIEVWRDGNSGAS